MTRSPLPRIQMFLLISSTAVGLSAIASCSTSGGGAGGGGAPAGGGDPGGGDAFTIEGESYPLPFDGNASFDVSAGGEAGLSAFAVEIFADTPTDSPSAATLALEPYNIRISNHDPSERRLITLAVAIAAADSTNPCEDGVDAGVFTVSFDGTTVASETLELPLTGSALAHLRTGRFSMCLSCTGDGDATMDIVRMTVTFSAASGPGPDEPDDDGDDGDTGDDFQVTFPDTGDAVVIIEETNGDTATFYGSVDEAAGEITYTGFDIETEDGPASVSADDQGRPTEMTMGSVLIEADHNTDGTVDLTLRDGDDVIYSGTNLEIDENLPEDFLAELDAGDGALKPAVPGRTARADSDPCEVDSRYIEVKCSQARYETNIKHILNQQGYANYSGTDYCLHPIYNCLVAKESNLTLAIKVCTAIRIWDSVRWIMIEECQENYGTVIDCEGAADKATKLMRDFAALAMMAEEGVVEGYWDDPDCGCPAQSCSSSFVCTDGQCVPKCTDKAGDCPSGLVCDTGSGQCEEDQGEGGDGSLVDSSWDVDWTRGTGGGNSSLELESNGECSLRSGNNMWTGTAQGTWQLSGSEITLVWGDAPYQETWTGTVSADGQSISGQVESWTGDTGTWEAERE